MSIFGQPQQPGIMGGGMPRVPFSQNPIVTALGASLLGGRTPNKGLEMFAQAAPQAMNAKMGMQQQMLAQQEKAAATAEAKAKEAQWNQILSNYPDIPAEMRPILMANPALATKYFEQKMAPAGEAWESLTDPAARLSAGIPETDMRPAQRSTTTGEIKFPGGGGTTVNNNIGGDNSADGKLREKLSEAEGERWSIIQKTGSIASSRAQDFGVMEELLKIAPQGPITGRLAEIFPGFSSAGDAAAAITTRLAPTLRVEGSGATSDLEYNGMLRSLPSLSKDPVGNQIILETMKAKASVDMERAAIVTAYQNNQMTAVDARAAMMELDRKSILTPRAKALIEQAAGTAPVDAGPDGFTPEELDAELKRRGL